MDIDYPKFLFVTRCHVWDVVSISRRRENRATRFLVDEDRTAGDKRETRQARVGARDRLTLTITRRGRDRAAAGRVATPIAASGGSVGGTQLLRAPADRAGMTPPLLFWISLCYSDELLDELATWLETHWPEACA